jgi:hypothetical protein
MDASRRWSDPRPYEHLGYGLIRIGALLEALLAFSALVMGRFRSFGPSLRIFCWRMAPEDNARSGIIYSV